MCENFANFEIWWRTKRLGLGVLDSLFWVLVFYWLFDFASDRLIIGILRSLRSLQSKQRSSVIGTSGLALTEWSSRCRASMAPIIPWGFTILMGASPRWLTFSQILTLLDTLIIYDADMLHLLIICVQILWVMFFEFLKVWCSILSCRCVVMESDALPDSLRSLRICTGSNGMDVS